jgi:hypothetical protein
MDPQLRARADNRLQEAAAALGLADPRPAFRDRLRHLREQHPDAFSRAVAHYENDVLPALAEEPDPVATWVGYGTFLGGLTAEGRAYRVDATGRATTFRAPARAGELILFVAEEARADVLVMAAPAQPSAAQDATVDLLVNRKLSLRD